MKKWLGYTLLILAILSLAVSTASAQKKEGSMDCRDSSWNNDRLQNHCEIREQTVPAGGAITVDAGRNGGVSVKGWNKGEILVRARVCKPPRPRRPKPRCWRNRYVSKPPARRFTPRAHLNSETFIGR